MRGLCVSLNSAVALKSDRGHDEAVKNSANLLRGRCIPIVSGGPR